MDTQTAHTVLVAHPNPELYGADRMLLESVIGLVDAGSRVVVTLPDHGPLVSELEGSGAEVELCPTPVLRKSYANPMGLGRLAAETVRDTYHGLKLLRQVRPDVIYVSTVTIPLWLVLAKLIRRPVVAHVHEAENSAPRLVRWALAAPLHLATLIFSNSQYSTSVIVNAIPRLNTKISQLSNGVHGPATIVPGRDQTTPPIRLLYVGRLSSRKGVDIAIDAVSKLIHRGHSIHLDIVGAVYPGYEWYEDELRVKVAELKLSTDVTFHGFHADIWPFLANTDIALVLSRIDEPFGNTAVEALLAARPLVVSDTSGLREAAGGYASARFVPVDSPNSVAEAVEFITVNWEKYQDSALADAQLAAKKHSPANYQQQIRDAIQSLQKIRSQR